MPSWLCGIEAVGEITVRLLCFPTYWTGMFQCARTQTVGTADEILSQNLHTHTLRSGQTLGLITLCQIVSNTNVPLVVCDQASWSSWSSCVKLRDVPVWSLSFLLTADHRSVFCKMFCSERQISCVWTEPWCQCVLFFAVHAKCLLNFLSYLRNKNSNHSHCLRWCDMIWFLYHNIILYFLY